MKLKELRKYRGMTQKDLAESLGINVSIISKYENGHLFASSITRINEIAKCLGVEPREIDEFKLFFPDFKELTREEEKKWREEEERRRTEAYAEKLIYLSAAGKCELCEKAAPFKDKSGNPYLEIHRLSKFYKGSKPEANMIALCPNCHALLLHNPSNEDLARVKEIVSSHSFV